MKAETTGSRRLPKVRRGKPVPRLSVPLEDTVRSEMAKQRKGVKRKATKERQFQ